MELKYVTLYADSMSSEIDFCTNKLGFRILKRTKTLSQRDCVILTRDNAGPELIVIEGDGHSIAGSTVVLNTQDFLKDHFELKNIGIQFLSEPEYTVAGIAAAFNDPSGNRWVLIEERDYSAN